MLRFDATSSSPAPASTNLLFSAGVHKGVHDEQVLEIVVLVLRRRLEGCALRLRQRAQRRGEERWASASKTSRGDGAGGAEPAAERRVIDEAQESLEVWSEASQLAYPPW